MGWESTNPLNLPHSISQFYFVGYLDITDWFGRLDPVDEGFELGGGEAEGRVPRQVYLYLDTWFRETEVEG